MLHSKRGVTNKKAGFSLIELLVVVAIIGILAAVAIPAYNNYRADAAKSALSGSLSNVARAFQACTTLKTFANCDSLTDINVNCPNCDNNGGISGIFCADAESEIGGQKWRGCVSVNTQTGTSSYKYSENVCYVDIVPATTPPANNCDVDGDGTNDAKTAAGYQGGDCENQALPLTACFSDADCTGAGVGDVCSTGGATGVCDPATGTCG